MQKPSSPAALRPLVNSALLLLLTLFGCPDSAGAQVVTDPHKIEFPPSADHNTTLADGRPAVDHYVLGFFYQGATAPFQSNQIGKPAPGANGLILIDLTTAVTSWPLPTGAIEEARVAAVGPGGSVQSSPSNPFTFSGPCAYSLSPSSVTMPSAGGTGNLTVNTGSGCAWTTTSNAPWITVTLGSTMTGVGFATFSVAANQASSARTGTLTVAGQTVTVTQAGTSCTFTLSTTALSVAPSAGTGSVGVTTTTGCSWTAASNASWLTLGGGNSGSGTGTVTFAVTANSSTSPRTGTLAVAGQTVTVTQAGALSPPSTAGAYKPVFSTYVGGPSDDADQGVFVDSAGNAYIVGGYNGGSFPSTLNACGTDDSILGKFSPTGALVWSRCIGGSAKDYIHSALIDAQGSVFIAGVTFSTNFPTTSGAYQPTLRGVKDVFIMKLSSAGAVLWSTLLGGSGDDHDRSSLALDAAGNLYVSGATRSTDFPVTPGAYQTVNKGGNDGYVAKLSADGRSLLASTYFGGAGDDTLLSGVHVHSDGTVYAGGFTTSSNIPVTAGAFQRTYGGGAEDGLIVRFTSSLSGLVFATYLGGNGADRVSENHGFRVDAAGRSIVAGTTSSSNLPVSATAAQPALRGGSDSYVAILAANGQSLAALTYLGGSGTDLNSGVDFDGAGNVYVTGETFSRDFPLASPIQSTVQAKDMTVTVLSPGLSSLVFSTLVGGTGDDRGRGVAATGGRVVVSGDSYSTNFPVSAGAYQTVARGMRDLVLLSFTPNTTTPAPTCTSTVTPASLTFPASGGNATVSIASSDPSCAWVAAGSSWLSVTPTSGTSSGTVTVTAAPNVSTSARTLSITIAGQTVSAAQAGSACSWTLSSTAMSVAATGGTGTIGVTAQAGCSWTAASNASWITVTSGSSGTGAATVAFSVPTNPLASLRTGTLTVAGRTVTITQAGTACTYTLSTTALTVGPTAGTGSVGVTTTTGCSWTAASNASWLTLGSGNSGSGTGTVTFSVTANSSTSPRTGTLTVAGQTVTITQAGTACTYTLSSTALTVGPTAGTGSVGVTTTTGCSWTAASNASWLTLGSGNSGSGTGTVTFSVTANSSTSPRTGTLTVAGRTVTITQAGTACTYTLSSTALTVGPTAGTGSVGVTTTTGCSWTAASNASWLTLGSGNSGSGTGTVTFSVTANSSTSPRTGTLTVAGQTVTITQAGTACTYTLSSTALTVGPTAGTGSVGVTTTTGCSWTAASNASWLTLGSGNSGSGTGTVTFAVTANSSTSPRTGTLTVAGRTVTITQAGTACTYTLSSTALTVGPTAGTGSVGVTTTTGCSWAAASNASWLTLGSGNSGSGTGTVTFSVTANSSTSPRTGTLAVAGQTETVTQAGALSPPSTAGAYRPVFSTYVGGPSDDADQGVFVDSAGNAYIVGGYNGGSFPATLNACGTDDSILGKFSPTGALVWSRCIGGSAKDYIHSALIDAQGSVFIAGVTFSTNFPTTSGAYQPTLRGVKDVFIMKLSSAGAVLWSTLLGGSGDDHDRSTLALDAAGNLYVSGATRSTDFPVTPGAYQTVNKGGNDGYVAKLSADGRSLLASTYFGGAGDDTLLSGVHVHSDGTVYAGGFTTSSNIPVTAGAFQRTYGGGAEDGLIVRFTSSLSGLVFATYLGGNGADRASENHGFRVDAAGRSIVAGTTSSSNLPVSATAAQPAFRGGSFDTYVAILAANGQSLAALTYLGGSGNDSNSGVDFDGAGNVYVTGETFSRDFPLASPIQSTVQAKDMTVTVLSPGLSSLVFSTLVGGTGDDRGRGVAATGGRVVVSGDSYSTNFPVSAGAYQTVARGMRDLVLLSFTPNTTTPAPTCTSTVTPASLTFPASGGNATVSIASSDPSCAWVAAGSSWLSVTPTSGTSSGTVTVTAAPNVSTSARTLSITIAGQTVSAAQAGSACSWTLSSTAMSVAATGGTGTIGVTAQAGCSWTAASNASWITVTSGSSGTGAATVAFSVPTNPLASPRTGTLTVAGRTVTITQAGTACTYTLSTTAVLLPETAATASVGVTALAGCSWTATSNAGWITVSGGGSWTASGTVAFSVTANSSTSPRTGTLSIGGQSLTVTQAAAACTYTLSAQGQAFTSAGGSGSVGVTASGAQCSWSASSTAGWLTITAGATGTGNGTVAYSVAPNSSTSDLSGSLRVAGLGFTVAVAAASAPVSTTVRVSSESQLQAAIRSLTSDTTVVLAPGTYALTSTLAITGPLRNVALQGSTGNAGDIVLVGTGMNNPGSGTVAEAISTAGAIAGVTIADLTIRDVYLHAVHLAAGTTGPRLRNVRLVNVGQAFVRADVDQSGVGVDDGIVQGSLFERVGPSRDANTTAIDVRKGARWQIRGNIFRNLVAPSGQTGAPAVLMTLGSADTVTEQNTFLNCQRGIAYGWTDRTGFDHSGGVIRNNFIHRSASQPGEAAILVNDSPRTEVVHNTILLSGTYATPIEYRYPDTIEALVANNLLDGNIWARDGAVGQDTANDVAATPAYFVDATAGNLHVAPGSPAIDRAALLPHALTDWDGDARPLGGAADMGADEAAEVTRSPAVAIVTPADGSSFTTPTRVRLSATAVGFNGTIAMVFYANSVKIGSATAAPFEVVWKTGKVTGSFRLTAVAVDNRGAGTTSAPVTVTLTK